MSLQLEGMRYGQVARNKARQYDLWLMYPCKKCQTSGIERVQFHNGSAKVLKPCSRCNGTGVEPERIA